LLYWYTIAIFKIKRAKSKKLTSFVIHWNKTIWTIFPSLFIATYSKQAGRLTTFEFAKAFSINFRDVMGLWVCSDDICNLIFNDSKTCCKAVMVGSKSPTILPAYRLLELLVLVLFSWSRIICTYIYFIYNFFFFCVSDRMNQKWNPLKHGVLFGNRLEPPRAGIMTMFFFISFLKLKLLFTAPLFFWLQNKLAYDRWFHLFVNKQF
jgi:hypothetical protein